MTQIRNLRTKPVTPLVLIQAGKDGETEYIRYEGSVVTSHIATKGHLTKDEVEFYRSFPEDFLNESKTDEGPEAA